MEEIYNEIALAPWGYRSEPPYRVIATGVPDDALIAFHEFDTLPEAMAWFVRFQIGPMAERAAGVVDSNQAVVLGYRADKEDATWFGTEAGFAELARHHHPVIVLDWELQARDDGKPPHVPQDIVQ